MKNNKITVLSVDVTFAEKNAGRYISLTDIAKYKSDDPKAVIQNWLRNRGTLEFIGLWEQINNPDFNRLEFEAFKYESGSNAFTLSPTKWIEKTHAVGMKTSSGRYGGGTFAHQDIAFEFASWISAEFKLYLLKEFQRLKTEEYERQQLEWSVTRTIAKINYDIHTDAIKDYLIPADVALREQTFIYAGEADLLNLALFGQTAQEWRSAFPGSKGNLRDSANIQQLVVLSNMESMNAELIKQKLPPEKRLQILNRMAIDQMRVLLDNTQIKRLK